MQRNGIRNNNQSSDHFSFDIDVKFLVDSSFRLFLHLVSNVHHYQHIIPFLIVLSVIYKISTHTQAHTQLQIDMYNRILSE